MATNKVPMVEIYGIPVPKVSADSVKKVADGLIEFQKKSVDLTLENRLAKTAVRKALEYLSDFEQFMFLYGGD